MAFRAARRVVRQHQSKHWRLVVAVDILNDRAVAVPGNSAYRDNYSVCVCVFGLAIDLVTFTDRGNRGAAICRRFALIPLAHTPLPRFVVDLLYSVRHNNIHNKSTTSPAKNRMPTTNQQQTVQQIERI